MGWGISKLDLTNPAKTPKIKNRMAGSIMVLMSRYFRIFNERSQKSLFLKKIPKKCLGRIDLDLLGKSPILDLCSNPTIDFGE